jgi:hypothetical protein
MSNQQVQHKNVVFTTKQGKNVLKLRLVYFHELKTEVLLFGDDTLTDMQNLQIFKSVQLHIKRTKRFTHLWPPPPSPILLKINKFRLLSSHIQVW